MRRYRVREWKTSLREWRAAMGYTQDDAAREFDCSRGRIQKIEQGKSQLTRADRIAMAEIHAAMMAERESAVVAALCGADA